MTKEEAIAQLELTKKAFICNYADEYILEALDMAIRSLEAWEKVKEEIKNYDNFIICANGQTGIHIDKVLEIIDKHLSEVSE